MIKQTPQKLCLIEISKPIAGLPGVYVDPLGMETLFKFFIVYSNSETAALAFRHQIHLSLIRNVSIGNLAANTAQDITTNIAIPIKAPIKKFLCIIKL